MAGTWSLESDLLADPGARTEAFEGGPGSHFEMLPEYRTVVAQGPFPARVEVQGPDATLSMVPLSCAQGLQTGLEDYDYRSLLCTGELPERFAPDPEVDAAWPVAIRIEGLFNRVAPCDYEYEVALFDHTGFEATWTLTLTGTCLGADCGSESTPTGSDGTALCIQGLSLSSLWTGCGEGASACREVMPDGLIGSCPTPTP